jgi:hypothetical protein
METTLECGGVCAVHVVERNDLRHMGVLTLENAREP